MKHPEFVAVVVLVIATMFVIAVFISGDADKKIKLTFDYGLLTILFLFAFLILAAIASGKIDIGTLLAENGGGASISRFQLLIFTFVISISFFLVVVHTDTLPNVPATVLTLLGISAGTYGLSKGIQAAGNLPSKSPTPATPSTLPTATTTSTAGSTAAPPPQ
jgi:hypothetical protein